MTIQKISGTPEQLLARRKWVDALRSGKYAQTTGTLRDQHGFCCLGVACDVSGKGEWAADDPMNGFEYVTKDQHISLTASLGDGEVAEFYGIHANGSFDNEVWKNGRVAHALYQLNDALHWDFPKIADFIESRWEVAPAA